MRPVRALAAVALLGMAANPVVAGAQEAPDEVVEPAPADPHAAQGSTSVPTTTEGEDPLPPPVAPPPASPPPASPPPATRPPATPSASDRAPVEACRDTPWCRDYGLCQLGPAGKCIASSDADCEQARVCRDAGYCEARQQQCGPLSYIPTPEDDEEPRYVPNDDRSRRRNVPVLVGGIVLTTAGAGGLVWLLAELSQKLNWEHARSGGEGRIAGAVALTVIGLAAGIPMIVMGARSRPASMADTRVPTLALGPGAFALQWSY